MARHPFVNLIGSWACAVSPPLVQQLLRHINRGSISECPEFLHSNLDMVISLSCKEHGVIGGPNSVFPYLIWRCSVTVCLVHVYVWLSCYFFFYLYLPQIFVFMNTFNVDPIHLYYSLAVPFPIPKKHEKFFFWFVFLVFCLFVYTQEV